MRCSVCLRETSVKKAKKARSLSPPSGAPRRIGAVADVKTRAGKGHEFGLKLSANDKEGADRVSQDALNRRIGVQPVTLRQLLGIDLPIIQAPMAGAQGSAMAIAVSNAGGLGSLPCAMLSLEAMRNELATIKAQTDRPFNDRFGNAARRAPAPA